MAVDMIIAIVNRRVQGNARVVIADVSGSDDYTTGGEPIVDADVAALVPESHNLDDVEFCDSETSPGGFTLSLDRANGTFVFFANGTESSSSDDNSEVVVRVRLSYGGAAVPTG